MVATVVVTVLTHNLAIGVVVGVLVAMTLFARRVAHLTETHRELVEDEHGGATAVYRVTGELFFASSNDLYTQFDYVDDPDRVVIDLTESHVWDASTVAALDAITTKYQRKGKTVEIVGLNASSADRHGRLSGKFSAALGPGRPAKCRRPARSERGVHRGSDLSGDPQGPGVAPTLSHGRRPGW